MSMSRSRASASRLLVGSSSSRIDGRRQQPRGQRQQHELATRHRGDRAVEPEVAEAEPGQLGFRTFGDVPAVADDVEVVDRGRAALDAFERREGRGDAEHLRDGLGRVGARVLWQVGDRAVDADRAALRRELAGDQPQQRRLARAVEADEAVPAGADAEIEAVEDDGAVGPGEREVVDRK